MKLIELLTGADAPPPRIADLYDREYGSHAPEFSAWDASSASAKSGRFILCNEPGEKVVAYGAVWHTGHDKFRLDLIVDPQHRRHGLGGSILEHLVMRATALGARTLQARTDREAMAGLSFLQHRRFRETLRMHRFELNVSRAASHLADSDRLAHHGIAIQTLAETGASRVYGAIAEIYEAASDEWPDPDPGGPRTPLTESGVRDMFERWRLIPEAVFLARSGDQYVGFCGIGAEGKSMGTAVRPEFRGRGVATALRTRLIRWAAANGISRLQSTTAHSAMIRLNRNLGFEETSVEVRLVRRFS